MTKLKSTQKIRIVRYFGNEKIIIHTTVGRLAGTVDYTTTLATEQALKKIVEDCFRYKGIGATFNGINIQVDLLD
jgi:hypothetical protein